MQIKKISRYLLCFFSLACILKAQTPDVDINEAVRKIDELYRSKTSHAKIEMEIQTVHWKRTLQMEVWSRGKNHTFVRILSPVKEKNMATLRIGSEMWNYLPNANKVIKIPPSMMMSSWMGSDFSNDDLVKESSMMDDYFYKFISFPGALLDMLYIEFVPKEDSPVVWSKIILAVRKPDYIPVWEKYYDERGNLVRVMDFRDIKEFDKRKIPSVLEMLPQNKPDQKTIIRYLNLEFDIKLSNDIFTLRNLYSRE